LEEAVSDSEKIKIDNAPGYGTVRVERTETETIVKVEFPNVTPVQLTEVVIAIPAEVIDTSDD
jgi:hypothetical protein